MRTAVDGRIFIQNKCINLHAVNCRPNALKQDRSLSFIAQIPRIVGDQKLRGHKAFQCQ